jgi:rhodanese-related sulfurtransferase
VVIAPAGSIGVDGLLDQARSLLQRVTPTEAARELVAHLDPARTTDRPSDPVVLVDIRPEAQRRAEGEVHPAYRPLVIERNVLEWRLDPRSDARLPIAAYGLRVIVLCQEGYTSSLAAAALHQLGVRRATDVDGGFAAWRAAGLPVA